MTLSEELKRMLKGAPLGAVTLRDSDGTVHLLVKLPSREITGLRGPVPLRHCLVAEDVQGVVVIAWVLAFYDDPTNPLIIDSYLNVGRLEDREILTRLQKQADVPVHLVDAGTLDCRLSKRVSPPRDIATILQKAARLYQAAPWPLAAYDLAKATFRRTYSLSDLLTMAEGMAEDTTDDG